MSRRPKSKTASAAISGMTGFARVEGGREGLAWAWEARSVNGRGLDVRLRLAPGFEALEPKAREAVQKRFTRGSVQVALQTKRVGAETPVRINEDRLKAYVEAAAKLVTDGRAAPPRADGLLSLRGVIEADDGEPDADTRATLEAALAKDLEDALDALQANRREEGAAIEAVLRAMLSQIEELRGAAVGLAAAQPEALRDRVRQKFSELLESDLSEERLAVEAAALAAKADVREELDRLAAHVEAARGLLDMGGAAGRRLDFLSQEFMREANTLCSKSSDLELTRVGLEIKAVVDQLKEQAANVE